MCVKYVITQISASNDREASANNHANAFVGKPLPAITLQDAKGAKVPSARYLGHPLLLNLWATWCAPCLEELPSSQKIRASTRETDLAIIAVDQDFDTADSTKFLQRRGYDWPDFHYTNDLVAQLGVQGLPATILTDAGGKVVYYHTGAQDMKGLAAAIAALGEAYRKVSAD